MPTREALQLMERYNRAIAGLEDSTVERLHTAMDAAYRDLEKELRRTYPDIASNQTLLATQRKVLLLEQLGETLQVVRPDQAQFYQQTLQETLQTANQTGRTMADELISAVNPQTGIAPLADIPIEAAALQARDGYQRLRRHSEELRDKASAIVEQGLIQGWGPAKVADLLRSELQTTKSKAETIARTEILSALNDAAQQRYADNGIEGVQWICTIGDVCKFCVGRNTQVYPTGKVRVPAHPRCLPAGIVVSSPSVFASAKREYAGEVVVIQTASGKELTATPNHPVATPQGWVSIDSINEGDSIFSCLDSERVTSAIAPNHYNRPTLIEEIVAAFSESSGVSSVSMEVSSEDFHGDGEGSEVCVISTNSDLRSQFNPQLLQKSLELPLISRLVGQLSLLPDRLTAFLAPGKLTPSRCRMCGGNLLNSLSLGHLSPLQNLGFGLGANSNARILQNPTNSRSFNVESLSDQVFRNSRLVLANNSIPNFSITKPESLSSLAILDLLVGLGRSLQSPLLQDSSEEVGIEMEGFSSVLNRFPGLVVQDRVVKTFRKRFSGHVYNLETQTGWYFANDILTHNCRCVLLPWRPSWADKDLTDDEFIKEYKDQRLKDLEKLGLKPNNGLTPLEKAAGLTEPPQPVWVPGRRPTAATIQRLTPAGLQAVQRWEDSHQWDSVESAAIFDKDGRILATAVGEETSVEFTDQQIKLAKGAIVSHNHPPLDAEDVVGVGLSDGDIEYALENQVGEIRAISQAYRYSLRPGSAQWSKDYWEQTAKPVYDRHYDEVWQEIRATRPQRIADGLSEAEIWRLENQQYWHEVTNRTAKELGWEYRRVEWQKQE